MVRQGSFNPFVLEALTSSLIIALSAAVLSSILGTTAALALQRMRGPMRTLFDGLIYVSIMIPGIVIGIATLVVLVTVFDFLNRWWRQFGRAMSGRRICPWALPR
jgi:spermidine/putrescine transport system permease protein